MGLQVEGAGTPAAEYHVRRFRADDVDAYLDLQAAATGGADDRARFAWRYEDNPYVYHLPILVAERADGGADGDLVAARPFLALELAVDGRRHLALQPCDAVVHPEHRGRGLFGRLTEAALDAYRDCEVSFVFAFPPADDGHGVATEGDGRGGATEGDGGPRVRATADCRDGATAADYVELGFERVGDHPTYYRVQDAGVLARAWSGRVSAAARALQPVVDGYNGLSNRRLRPPSAVTVERYDSVPAAMLAGIEYDRRRHGIHVHRDVRFYDWRFDDPAREYAAYVAERAGEPIAGLVVGTADGGSTVRLTDVTPLPRRGELDGLEAILGRVLREHADADLLAAPPVFPADLAGRAGFRRDDRLALGALGTATTHVVGGLGEGTVIDGVDVADADNWQLSFAERDPD